MPFYQADQDLGRKDKAIFNSNQSESWNAKLAKKCGMSNLSYAQMFHVFRLAQNYQLYEVARAYMGRGDYNVLPKFASKDDCEKGEAIMTAVGEQERGASEKEAKRLVAETLRTGGPTRVVGRGYKAAQVSTPPAEDSLLAEPLDKEQEADSPLAEEQEADSADSPLAKGKEQEQETASPLAKGQEKEQEATSPLVYPGVQEELEQEASATPFLARPLSSTPVSRRRISFISPGASPSPDVQRSNPARKARAEPVKQSLNVFDDILDLTSDSWDDPQFSPSKEKEVEESDESPQAVKEVV